MQLDTDLLNANFVFSTSLISIFLNDINYQLINGHQRKLVHLALTLIRVCCVVSDDLFFALFMFFREYCDHDRDGTGQDFLDPTRAINFKIYAG